VADEKENYIKITSETNGRSIECGLQRPINNGTFKAFVNTLEGFFSLPANDIQIEKRKFRSGSVISQPTLSGRDCNLIIGAIDTSENAIELSTEVLTCLQGKLKIEIFYENIYRWWYCYLSSDGADVELLGKYDYYKGILASFTLVSEDSFKRGEIKNIPMKTTKTTEGGLMFPLFDQIPTDTGTSTLKFTGESTSNFLVGGADDCIRPTLNTYSANGMTRLNFFLDDEQWLYLEFSKKVNRCIIDMSSDEVYLEPTDARVTKLTGRFIFFGLGYHNMKTYSDVPTTTNIIFAEGWL